MYEEVHGVLSCVWASCVWTSCVCERVGGRLAGGWREAWRSARTWNLQACGVYFGASPKMM